MLKKGDRVIENERAPRSSRRLRDGVYRVGTVVGFSRDRECVRVRFDNFKVIETFHASYVDQVNG